MTQEQTPNEIAKLNSCRYKYAERS